MIKFLFIPVLSVLMLASLGSPGFCAEKAATTVPEAPKGPPEAPKGPPEAPKGAPSVPGAKALADLESATKRNNEMAVRHFSGLIEKNANDAAAYAGRGRAYSNLKDYDKALPDLEKAIELDPKQIDAYKGRAVIRYLKKDHKGSWEDVHQIEKLGGSMWPSFVDALKKSSGQSN